MKILIVSPYVPWPLYGGASVRMFNIIKELSKRGHKIVLVAGKDKNFVEQSNPLYQLCESIHLYELPSQGRFLSVIRSFFSLQPYPAMQFQNRKLYKDVRNLISKESFDIVWINFLFMASILLRVNFGKTPVILDQFEADELVWGKYIKKGNFLQRLFSNLNLKKIKILQKKAFRKINALMCVSEEEAKFMKPKMPSGKGVWVVPNGVDADFFKPSNALKKKQVILLSGSMCIVRNIDAAAWFSKNIFPKIRKAVPDAEFWIVGYKPDKKVLGLKNIKGVKVIGTVEDIRPYYQEAKVYVAPFRFGEGTRLKVIEAMAMGIPIASTRGGCQGINAVNGRHLLIADDEGEFGDNVINLLRNPPLAKVLADAALALVKQEYDWKAIVDTIESKINAGFRGDFLVK